MVNEAPQVWQTEDWNDVYIAALLEGDPDRVPFLIQEAERAIIERARELIKASGDIFEEEEALNDALYALRGLKSEPGEAWANHFFPISDLARLLPREAL